MSDPFETFMRMAAKLYEENVPIDPEDCLADDSNEENPKYNYVLYSNDLKCVITNLFN